MCSNVYCFSFFIIDNARCFKIVKPYQSGRLGQAIATALPNGAPPGCVGIFRVSRDSQASLVYYAPSEALSAMCHAITDLNRIQLTNQIQ